MGEYLQQSTFDPSSGALIGGAMAAPRVSFPDRAAQVWAPPAESGSCDPHGHPGYRDEATLGPTPGNIHGERSLRAFDDDAEGCDDAGACGEGGDDPHDGDYPEDGEDDDTGPIADNIVTDAEVFDNRGLLRGLGAIPGPMSRSR